MIIRAVVAQFPVSFSIPENLDRILSVLAQTVPGDLVLLPEGSLSGYSDDLSFLQNIRPHELHAGLNRLQNEAERRKINLWVGACVRGDMLGSRRHRSVGKVNSPAGHCEARWVSGSKQSLSQRRRSRHFVRDDMAGRRLPCPHKTRAVGEGNWVNAAYGFSPDGAAYTYHKINLATHERGVFCAGSDLPVFELQAPGGSFRVGVQMCRELRFPEQWGWMARRGAQIFLHLNNAVGSDVQQPVWKSHLVSRAAETQRFVLSANNAAPQQVCPTLAVAPDGQVAGEIVSPELGILRVELDLTKVSNWYLDQCRCDVAAIQGKSAA